VDTYNEKVVRSTMGSIFRSKIFESKNLVPDLKMLQAKGYTVIGMQMSGDSIKDVKFNKKTVCVFGSESQGISIQVQTVLNQSCTIPRIGEAESLNVAIAAGIVLGKISL
jgi:TrmH family RNA methyltransferase